MSAIPKILAKRTRAVPGILAAAALAFAARPAQAQEVTVIELTQITYLASARIGFRA